VFIPLHDDNPLENIPRQYVTWALIAANVLVFVFFQGAMAGDFGYATAAEFGLTPIAVPGFDPIPDTAAEFHDSLTFVTYSFLHADIIHLGGNMLFLWVFGDNVEDAMGHFRFFVFYMLCAIAGGVLHDVMLPTSTVPLIGASGAVAGIVAAYLVLHPRVRVWVLALGRIPLRLSAMWVLGAWIVLQVVNVVLAGPDTDIGWWAHIGGIIAGAVLVVVLRRPGVPLFDRPAEAR
jgi:membrane associated rhomboid family serine protease